MDDEVVHKPPGFVTGCSGDLIGLAQGDFIPHILLMGRCIKGLTVRVVRACVAAVFFGLLLSPKCGGLHPVLLQVFPGDVKPVWASRRGAVSRLLTKPRAQRPSAKASRHRTKLRSNRAARRELAHEAARAEAVDEGTKAPHEVKIKSCGTSRICPRSRARGGR